MKFYQKGPKLEVDFRYTRFFCLASDPPPPPPVSVTVATKPWPGRCASRSASPVSEPDLPIIPPRTERFVCALPRWVGGGLDVLP